MTKQDKKFFLILIGGLGFFTLALYLSQPLWVPIGVSGFLTYFLGPFVDRWSLRLPKKLVVSLCLFGTLLLFALLGLKVIPALYAEIVLLLSKIPDLVHVVTHQWLPVVRGFLESSRFFDGDDLDRVIEDLSSFPQLSEKALFALTSLWKTFPQFVGSLIQIALIPFITFFWLLHRRDLGEQFWFYVPEDTKEDLGFLFRKLDETLNLVIKGQFLIAAILGCLYVVGFTLIGVPSALVLGLVAGVCRVIPYMDVLLGGGLAFFAILADFHNIGQIFWLFIIFVVVQALDGMLITPKILGGRAGLHPLVVILSVLTFGAGFGVWGVLLAVPSIALGKTLIQVLTPYYLRSSFFSK
jgi:predicted PurR-regulated permease PerM